MRIIYILLCLITRITLNAQTVDFYGKLVDTKNLCQSLGFSDNKEAKSYLDTICNSIGIKSNFIMAPCNNIGTCLATVVNGDAYILYDNIFLSEIKKSALGFTEKKINSNVNKLNWQYLTILAHELGHFQNNHFSPLVRKTFSSNQLELQADEYAGFVIFKLGGTIEQGKQIYNSNIIPDNQSLEHPAKKERQEAFEMGYRKELSKSNKNELQSKQLVTQNDLVSSQIPAQFPGGISAWQRFLSKNLNSDIATEKGAPEGRYSINIEFIISPAGDLNDIIIESDPGFGIKDEVIKTLKLSPKWIPASQNGKNIEYRQKQSLTFISDRKK